MSEKNSKQKLLEVGVRLFAEHDYDKVTNKMVTDIAGLNSAMVSYYFATKENFYHEVVKYSSDQIIAQFVSFEPKDLANASLEELLSQIDVAIDIYLKGFFNPEGQMFSIIYYRNLIEASNSVVLNEYNRPIDVVTRRYIELFSAYYAKKGMSDVNPVFVMIKMASLTYFMVLHSRTATVLIPDQMQAMADLKKMLYQSVINGF